MKMNIYQTQGHYNAYNGNINKDYRVTYNANYIASMPRPNGHKKHVRRVVDYAERSKEYTRTMIIARDNAKASYLRYAGITFKVQGLPYYAKRLKFHYIINGEYVIIKDSEGVHTIKTYQHSKLDNIKKDYSLSNKLSNNNSKVKITLAN